jgi:hypothetical protein
MRHGGSAMMNSHGKGAERVGSPLLVSSSLGMYGRTYGIGTCWGCGVTHATNEWRKGEQV